MTAIGQKRRPAMRSFALGGVECGARFRQTGRPSSTSPPRQRTLPSVRPGTRTDPAHPRCPRSAWPPHPPAAATRASARARVARRRTPGRGHPARGRIADLAHAPGAKRADDLVRTESHPGVEGHARLSLLGCCCAVIIATPSPSQSTVNGPQPEAPHERSQRLGLSIGQTARARAVYGPALRRALGSFEARLECPDLTCRFRRVHASDRSR